MSIPDLSALTALERARDRLWSSAHHLEQDRCGGVCWSGMGPDPWRPRDETRIRADAALRLQRLEAWRASADGRLLACVSDCQRAAQAAYLAAESARAAISRGLSHNAAHCDAEVAAIAAQGRALLAAARAARRALAAGAREPGTRT